MADGWFVDDAESTPGADRAEGRFVVLRIAGGLTIGVIWVGSMLAFVALFARGLAYG